MALAPGTRLGAYEISVPLGAGGMGEVYRARDTRLHRDVAIKVLPEALAHDIERLARFEREARTLASLNHPNIAQIHGLEESAGIKALVMELVEGPTLADRIAKGPMPLDEALPIARQMAEALEAAHEQGIVHRDLKPANVKVRPDGVVKVLDFGLAKLVGPPEGGRYAGDRGVRLQPDLSQSPTITTPAMTQMGVILGTAAYMSPEQARGRGADKRSDVWAFGCLLYEVLTGRQAFPGEDVVETLGAVIHKSPDWTALPADTPQAIRRLLERCLRKERRQRLPDIGMARLEIEDAISEPPATVALPPHTGSWRHERLAWYVAASLLVAVAALATALWWRPPLSESRTYRASILPLDEAPLVGLPPGRFTLSPDGEYLVFTSGRPGVPATLWLRSLDRDSPRELAGTEGAAGQFWSPDGRFIAFFAQGQLKKVDITGGPPVSLTEADSGATAGTWNNDDVIVFPRLKGGLYRISAGGGAVTAVTTLDAAAGDNRHWWPYFLPDGKHFLYEAVGSTSNVNDPRAVYIGSLDPNEKSRLLLTGGSNAKYAEGYVLFMRETTLMAQPLDTRRLELTGEPLPVAEAVDIGGSTRQSGAFSVSTTGVLVYQTAPPESSSQLVWFDRNGKQLGVVPQRAVHDGSPELSRDGTRAAIAASAGSRGPNDIWIVDLVRGVRWPFTRGDREETRAIWSPDGSRIIFNARTSGTTGLYIKSSSGAESEQPLLDDSSNTAPYSWSRDGRYVLYATVNAVDVNLWVLPLTGDRKPIPYMQTPFNENGARFSPDDRWVAFGSNESGSAQIYVAPFPATGAKDLVSVEPTMAPAIGARWRADGRELFYVSRDGMLMATDIDVRGTTPKIRSAKSLFQIPGLAAYDVAPDGGRFLFSVADTDRTSSLPAALTLVINWTAALAKH